MAERPQRAHPTHGILALEGQPTILFDTICTRDRLPWLANPEVHRTLHEVWTQADAWKIGRYVIMPDHIHVFAAEVGATIPYENWVRYWKSQFTKRHGISEHRWLPHHWETRMRSQQAMEEKWHYILNNPVRKGLVEIADQWPYQGEVFHYTWT